MKQKNYTKKTTRSRSKSRTISCKKSHGHLICWIQSKKSPSKKQIFLNFVIPGTHNNHRPHLIRRSSLLVIVGLLFGLQVLYNITAAHRSQILSYATNVSSADVRRAVNTAREDSNEQPLKVSSELNKAASMKAADMLQKDYWSHNSPSGDQPWKWFEQAGYSYQNAGENLAKDFMTSDGLVKAWLDSKSHRDNVLNPAFHEVGIAAVNGTLDGKKTTLVVAMFGTKKPRTTLQSGTVTSVTTSSRANLLSNPAQVATITNPLSIITLVILVGVILVALLTHWHFIKLPKKARKSWYKHHALYTASLALLAATYTVYIFTSGSI